MEWLQILALILGNITIIIPLWLWNRSESRADNRDVMNLVRSIQEEMKDFHTRLALQDQEFKMRMTAIEEKRKSNG